MIFSSPVKAGLLYCQNRFYMIKWCHSNLHGEFAMTYTPKSKNSKAKIICTILLIGGLAIWLFSAAVDIAYPIVPQFLAVTLICSALAIASRWIFCSYVYSLQNNDLVVTQMNRGKTDVFRLPLGSIVSIENGKIKRDGKRYNYNVTLAGDPKDCYTLIFEYSGEKITALLECDENFILAIKAMS
jgi:hypothetical protein